MSSSTAVDAAPALERLRAAVDELVELPLWRLPDSAGPDLLAELEMVGRRLAFTGIRIVADIEARNIAREQAGITTTEFLRQRLRISPSEAKARLRAAKEAVESVSPSGEPIPASLADTAAGISTGELSLEHVRVVSRAVEKLPTGIDPALRTEVESTLAEQAHDLDPASLATVARRIHAILDPDGVLDSDKPRRRELAFVRDAGGCDLIRGRLDAEGAAVVRTAIDAISAPEPQDTRSTARRRADGLIELCRRYLDTGQLPATAGEKPHITVTMRLSDLSATLNTGQAITAEQARRIACDAAIIPVVLGSKGEPLDVGRATRTIPPAVRRALTARDKGCVHPGCPQPAEWCDAHHVRHWTNGGPTALHNLVLLCRKHHWIVHHTAWRIAFYKGFRTSFRHCSLTPRNDHNEILCTTDCLLSHKLSQPPRSDGRAVMCRIIFAAGTVADVAPSPPYGRR